MCTSRVSALLQRCLCHSVKRADSSPSVRYNSAHCIQMTSYLQGAVTHEAAAPHQCDVWEGRNSSPANDFSTHTSHFNPRSAAEISSIDPAAYL